MTKQQQITLRIEHRTQKNALSLLVQAIPPDQMEPGVRKLFEQKRAVVAELERRMAEGYPSSS